MPAEVSEGESTSVSPAEPPVAQEAPLLPLAGGALSPPPLPPDESVTHRCANCLTLLTGPFCAQCGQHVADYHQSVWRFVADFFDNFLCWDNKILRTLSPLLKRPGWLTQEFMAGRRVRYVHPLRLFLFTSAVCLTLLQYTHHSKAIRVRVDKLKQPIPGAALRIRGGDEDDDDDEKKPSLSPSPAASMAPTAASASPAPTAAASPGAHEATLGQVFQDNFVPGSKDGRQKTGQANEGTDQQLEAATGNLQKRIDAAGGAKAFGEKMTSNIQQKLSWVALAMLPIFALLMRAAYGRSGGYYFTYLVFSLHYHTFLLLYWVGYTWLDALAGYVNRPMFQIPGFLVGLCLLVPPYYLYRALRQMYGQGGLATTAKVFAIGALHLLALFVGLAIIGATSFL